MYRFFVFLFLTGAFIFTSCNKDDETAPEEQQQSDSGFFALKVGNTWTYNYFRRNTQTGELTNLGGVEEVEITREEIENNETIFTVQINTSDPNNSCSVCNHDPMLTLKVKDSLGYLVEVGGEIKFSSISTVDYLVRQQEFGDIYRVLKENEVLITVPAGQFSALNNERYAIDPDGNRFNGRDNLYYADGIGEVRQTISGVVIERIIFEKQLISYSIQ